jgi:hypothetical protein
MRSVHFGEIYRYTLPASHLANRAANVHQIAGQFLPYTFNFQIFFLLWITIPSSIQLLHRFPVVTAQ